MEKSTTKAIQKEAEEAFSAFFNQDAFFIIGVSGGPDSMALLYLLKLLNRKALVVHVNYGKRGEESDKDQELVEQIAFQWGFECCSVQLNPEDAEGENFQNWARQKRYQFFSDFRQQNEADAILTAHHRDDQVETIIQKLFRGSSPEAWQGMKIWDGELFRPLLKFTKRDILDFCEQHAVPYRMDESNQSSDFARNFLRNEMSEKLDDLFPGWQQNILALPEMGKSYEAAINEITRKIYEAQKIDLKAFLELEESLKIPVLKKVLDDLGQFGRYSKGQLKELVEIEELQTGKGVQVGDVKVVRGRDSLHFRFTGKVEEIEETISKIEAERGAVYESLQFKIENEFYHKDLALDAAKIQWPVTLRIWKRGDKIQLLGMQGHQKISDHLTNKKIPTVLREKALVLCGSDSTIYAIIYPPESLNAEAGAVSETVKYNPQTPKFLTIKVYKQ